LQFTSLVLYPAGYKTDGIQAIASVRVPDRWEAVTSLPLAVQRGDLTTYGKVDLTTLFDSPLMAGRYYKRYDLAPDSLRPVRFDVFGESPEHLDPGADSIASLREMVQQAYKIFGQPPYDHYDFLIGVSDWLGDPELEHLRSTEIAHTPKEFKQLNTSGIQNYAEPHEFVHAWNGKFRRPEDLSTANLNVPMHNSLLWVYEGQAQYWGDVLETRSKFRSLETERDRLAAAFATLLTGRAGRQWRDLQDTLHQEIITARSPANWPSWQRSLDYYNEGTLIWLGIDSKIRAITRNNKSLDDFAVAFFDAGKSLKIPSIYEFRDVVRTLNAITPYDWATHIQERLTAHDERLLLDDLSALPFRAHHPPRYRGNGLYSRAWCVPAIAARL
jgi:predicted metalloprotease with PDZ domain